MLLLIEVILGGALINSAGELVGISTLSIGKNANEIAEGLKFRYSN